MQSLIEISCKIAPSNQNKPLGFEIWIDDQIALDVDQVKDVIDFKQKISDDEGQHQLRFVLKNKNKEHTLIDTTGNIIDDSCLTVTDVCVDGIELGNLFYQMAIYQHDFNGNGQSIEESFYGTMGCNGVVSLKFSTPMYLWLLENL